MNIQLNNRTIDSEFLRSKEEYAKLTGTSRQMIEYDMYHRKTPIPYVTLVKHDLIYLPDQDAFKMENIIKLIAKDVEEKAMHFPAGEVDRTFNYSSCSNLHTCATVYVDLKIRIDFDNQKQIVSILELNNFSVMNSSEMKELVNFDMMLFEVELEKALNKLY